MGTALIALNPSVDWPFSWKGREMSPKVKVVLTDYVWESLDVENKTLGELADLVALQTKTAEEFLSEAADCDALLNTESQIT